MTERMKSTLWLVCIGAAGLLAAYSYLKSGRKGKPPSLKEAIVAEKARADATLSGLAQKYGAVTDWSDAVLKKGPDRPMFTVDLQEELIRADKKPVVFCGGLQDICRDGDKFFARFSSGYALPSEVVFELQCDAALATRLLATKSSGSRWNEEFAVVALVTNVRKAVFSIRATNEGDMAPDAEVDVTPSDRFLAQGTCLDCVSVGDDKPKTER